MSTIEAKHRQIWEEGILVKELTSSKGRGFAISLIARQVRPLQVVTFSQQPGHDTIAVSSTAVHPSRRKADNLEPIFPDGPANPDAMRFLFDTVYQLTLTDTARDAARVALEYLGATVEA